MNQTNKAVPENKEDKRLTVVPPSHSQEEIQHKDVPPHDAQGEEQPFTVPAPVEKPESPLLRKVRDNFNVFGRISISFGALFTLLFYKAGVGLNLFIFTLVMVVLLGITIRQLSQRIKSGTKYYYAGAVLLSAATFLTSNETLQFLNVIGILLLLDLSLLHQFYDDRQWDFLKHFLKMLAMPFQCIGAVGLPFIDCFRSMKNTRVFKNEKVRNIFIGILISIPFLWIITMLLVSADLLFGQLTKDVFDAIFQGEIYAILFMILLGFLLCYCIICAAVSKVGLEEKSGFKKAEASIAATVMVILTLVYLVFCSIQVAYLFAGGLFELPAGYTFAEYARRGFFELLAVAIINVALMVLCRSLFEESRSLRIVITVMTACTYIMIASATYRMLLYIGAYHLTFLRVFVLLALLIIALVLAGVIVAEYNNRFPLFRYCVIVVSICYIAFSFSKPDYYIAKYNISQNEELEMEDMAYLTYELSLDAAPAVLPLLPNDISWKEPYLQKIAAETGSMGFREFNYADYLAGEALEKYNK